MRESVWVDLPLPISSASSLALMWRPSYRQAPSRKDMHLLKSTNIDGHYFGHLNGTISITDAPLYFASMARGLFDQSWIRSGGCEGA